jgi:hypothetical protein
MAKLSEKTVKGIQENAQKYYNSLGINVNVVIFKGNLSALNKMDASDVVGVIGNSRTAVANAITKNLQPITRDVFRDGERIDQLKGWKKNGRSVPEITDGGEGKVFAVSLPELREFAKLVHANEAQTGGFVVVHATGHAVGYVQKPFMSGEGTHSCDHPDDHSIMSSGVALHHTIEAIKGGGSYTPRFRNLNDFVLTSNNARNGFIELLAKKFNRLPKATILAQTPPVSTQATICNEAQ